MIFLFIVEPIADYTYVSILLYLFFMGCVFYMILGCISDSFFFFAMIV